MIQETFYADIQENIIGIDEVGRGALCGPVVSCAVQLNKKILKQSFLKEIDDSKKINEIKRNQLANLIKKFSIFSYGICSNKIIDKINILQATNLSMKKAYENLGNTDNKVKIDGVKSFFLNDKTEFIKGGDNKSVVIAAASILAKSFRDAMMEKYSHEFPGYSLEKNKGYGSKSHLLAIKKMGITSIHRKSFAPIKNLLF
ncbi:MAG: ribonuclease HII [Rickettsiales bacterium]|nr:ribonuclease HII [Rickettsiales bacterium]